MERESTTGISDRTFTQAKQLEQALQRADTVRDAVTRFPNVVLSSIWASRPDPSQPSEVERHRVDLTEHLLHGLTRVAFARYLDLVEGQEVELARDILSQHHDAPSANR